MLQDSGPRTERKEKGKLPYDRGQPPWTQGLHAFLKLSDTITSWMGGWTVRKSAQHEVRVHVKQARFVYVQCVKEVDG